MTNPPLDTDAWVELLKKCARDYEASATACDTPLLARFRTERTEIAAHLSAIASALPGMGKDSDGWNHALALSADLTSMAKARDAWRVFGEHVAHCVECGETSYENCDEGHDLFKAAEAADDVLNRPIRSAARAAQPKETSADA